MTALTLATTARSQTTRGAQCAAIAQTAITDGFVVSADHHARGDLVFGNINPANLLFGGDSIATASTDICRIKVQLRPTKDTVINVDIWLPDTWNGKMFGFGGGGYSGGLGFNAARMNDIAARGYASVTSDLGHDASPHPIWALNQPEKIVDRGHRGDHLVAVVSKQLMASYYGSPIRKAYLIVPRFGGHIGLGGHALLGLLGCKIPEGRVHAVPVVVAFDVSEQRLSGFRLGRPPTLMDQFDLEGMEKALHRALS